MSIANNDKQTEYTVEFHHKKCGAILRDKLAQNLKPSKTECFKLTTFHFNSTKNAIIEEQLDQDRLDNEFSKKLMTESTQTVVAQKTKKKTAGRIILFLINIAIVAAIIIYNFVVYEPVSLAELFTTKIDWWWFLIGVFAYIFLNFLESLRTFVLIKQSTGRARPWVSYKSSAICRYYDSITPMSTGGQPFQIFYLNRRGLSVSAATSVPIAKYVMSQICFSVFITIVLIVHYTEISTLNTVVLTACWIGYILNLLLVVSVAFLAISKKVAPACTSAILKFLNKIHLIKNYRRTFLKVMRIVREYVAITRRYMKNFSTMFWVIISSVAYWLLNYSFPFIVYCMLVGFDINMWLPIVVATVVCDLASNFIPLPGGSGAAEGSFMVVFGAATVFTATGTPIFPAEMLVWAMLFWRLFSYYSNIIQGIGVIIYDFFVGDKKIAPMLERYKQEDEKKMQAKNQKNMEEINNGSARAEADDKSDTKNS